MAYKKSRNIDSFYASPSLYYDPTRNFNGWEHFAKNHMAFDLGFDNRIEQDEGIRDAIFKMEADYELVIIRCVEVCYIWLQ